MSFEDRPSLLTSTDTVFSSPRLPGRFLRTTFGTATSAFRLDLISRSAIRVNLLARLGLGVCALLTGAVFTLIAYGHLFPGTDVEAPSGLTRCAGLPCFRELIPEQTSWADALAAFGDRSIITSDGAYAKIALFPSAQRQTLAAILLDQPLDPSMTVAAMLARYGTPSCINIYKHLGTLILHFGSVHVLTRLVDHQISPSAHILTIVLGNPGVSPEQSSSGCTQIASTGHSEQSSQHFWQGFALIEHYLREN